MAVPRRKSSAYDGRNAAGLIRDALCVGEPNMQREIEFFYFIGSTYSYLSVARAEARAAQDGVARPSRAPGASAAARASTGPAGTGTS